MFRLLLFISVTVSLAHAQLTYSYRGNRMTGKMADGDLFHGQPFSAKLVTDEIIPADTTSPQDYRGSKPCPTSWYFAIALGGKVFDSRSADQAACSYVGSIGNPLLPAYLHLEIRQATEAGPLAMHVCSHLHHRTYETLPCGAPFRDPNVDWVEALQAERRARGPNETASGEPGKWSAPNADEVAAALLARVGTMGNAALTAQVTAVRDAVRAGNRDRACSGLRSVNGSGMSAADTATTLRWAEYLSADLACSAK